MTVGGEVPGVEEALDPRDAGISGHLLSVVHEVVLLLGLLVVGQKPLAHRTLWHEAMANALPSD